MSFAPNSNHKLMIPETAAVIEIVDPSDMESFRPLKWNELVKRGDFVKDDNEGFEPWEGPAGFRADAFIKTIYRKLTRQKVAARKAS